MSHCETHGEWLDGAGACRACVDAAALRMRAELDRARAELAESRARNAELRRHLRQAAGVMRDVTRELERLRAAQEGIERCLDATALTKGGT